MTRVAVSLTILKTFTDLGQERVVWLFDDPRKVLLLDPISSSLMFIAMFRIGSGLPRAECVAPWL